MLLLLIVPFYLIISLFYNLKRQIGFALILSILVLSLLITFSTEYLSFFHVFNRTGLTTFWILVSGILVYFHRKKQYAFLKVVKATINSTKNLILEAKVFTKSIGVILILLLTLIVVQGYVYPPNNWDSMTYHLPRISHWILNNSIENFPTNITRQIYSPPFSEYAIAQTSILCDSDRFNYIVQFFYFLGTCFLVVEILKMFTQNKKILYGAFCLSITLPEAVLQASSTQNDIVHSFFLISALYFTLRFLKIQNVENASFFGIATGLALLSKIIAFFYIPALLLLIGIFTVIAAIKSKNLFPILSMLIAGILIIFINLNFSLRKFDFTHNISGTSENIEDGITFEKYSAKLLVSTCIKNITLHADPLLVGNLGNVLAEKSHLVIGQDINEKGTNVFDTKFNAVAFWRNHEDTQANTLVTLLFFCCIGVLIVQIVRKKMKWFSIETGLLVMIILQFITLNLIIRWEPWNSRIHTPLFFEIIIFCGLVLINQIKIPRYFYILTITFTSVFAVFLALFNYTRPLLNHKKYTSTIRITDTRYAKYFTNQPHIFTEFNKFHEILLSQNTPTNVGYISHIDGWEYPITSIIYENKSLHFDHIRITNSSSKYRVNKKYLFIYSSYINKDTLHFNNKIYKNLSPKNKYLFYYKKL
jgi:hypothetical protein